MLENISIGTFGLVHNKQMFIISDPDCTYREILPEIVRLGGGGGCRKTVRYTTKAGDLRPVLMYD